MLNSRAVLRSSAAAFCAALLSVPGVARASFLSPEATDTAAMYLAWFIIFVVPIGGIVLFWMVHVLPEKIAHKRHHPQRDAIHVLCLLSLVFGGLLWPIAWLWAYTKPTMHRMAWGTDKHEDYFVHMADLAEKGEISAHELQHLHDELEAVESRGSLTPQLRRVRERLEAAAAAKAERSAAPDQPVSGAA
ncbi:MAG: DUF3302 domain-containing protein [Rhizobacter sp.]|nr:DUF3302 domain-containing protein [Rhizobacter sp.]